MIQNSQYSSGKKWPCCLLGCCGREARWPSLLPGAAFSCAGTHWRGRLWVVLLNLNLCFADVAREGARGIPGQQSIPALPAPVVPWKPSLPSPGWGHKLQPDSELTIVTRVTCQDSSHPQPLLEGFLVFLPWPPLLHCMDVRSAEVKHIPVINMTKSNLELSKLVPGMVWAFFINAIPRVSLGFECFEMLLKSYFSKPFFHLHLLA